MIALLRMCRVGVVAASLLCAALLPTWAANIASQGRVLVDEVIINEGKSCEQLPPINSRPWADPTPFTSPDTVELWFPYLEPATINGIRCTALFDFMEGGMVQAWDGVRWTDVAPLPVLKTRKDRSVKVTFAKPVTTHALRLFITKVGNADHDRLQLTDFNIDGTLPKAEALYNPKDVSLACDAKYNVFDLPNPARVQVTVGNSLGTIERFRMKVAWTNNYLEPAGTQDLEETFTLAKGQTRAWTPTLSLPVQGPYVATVSLFDPARNVLLARQRLLVGLRDARIFEQGIVEPLDQPGQPIMPFRARLQQMGTIWGTELSQAVLTSLNRRPGEEAFATLKLAGCDMVDAFIDYSLVEPLPGVYNFNYFDHMVRMTKQYGLGLNIAPWRWPARGLEQYWLYDELTRQRDGSPMSAPMNSGTTGAFSFWGPQYQAHAFRAMEALIKRYNNSPSVWMWHPHPYGMVDHDAIGVEDGSVWAKAAFAKFLQAKYATIEKLNTAYATQYADFAAVPMPIPLWQQQEKLGKYAEMTRTLDTSPAAEDYFAFYNGDGPGRWRIEMMKLVRKYDTKRGISGVYASSGVGAADEVLRAMQQYDGGTGDQDIDFVHYFRRFIGMRQYGLHGRFEDHFPFTPGRLDYFKPGVNYAEASNWDMFQACFIGADQFNYTFPTWEESPFWDIVFANPRAKRLLQEAARAEVTTRPVAVLHSYLSDTHEGKYVYNGMDVANWWLMNGLSRTMIEPGLFFDPINTGGPLAQLDQMKVLIDDGSHLIPQAALDRLVRFVQEGGKLVLVNSSGERLQGAATSTYPLLSALGYEDLKGIANVSYDDAELGFYEKNGIFSETGSMPVHAYSVLSAPKGGRVLGEINGKPGAVAWPVGKGEVVLLGGNWGRDYSAQFEVESATGTDAARKKALWGTMSKLSENQFARTGVAIMHDMARWADIPLGFTVNAGFVGARKADGKKTLIYLYNEEKDCATPVLSILDLPTGDYQVTCESLSNTVKLSRVSAQALAQHGVVLPLAPKGHLMLVRFTPVK
ncbi:MAG TPA: beta-galactosidase [Armatimonadota bacterium]|jgi:hypothetical protein